MSSEEEEEEGAGDVFDMEAMAVPEVRRQSPNRSLASMRGMMSEVGTAGTRTLASMRGTNSQDLPPRNSARRGSVVQVGGRSTALSQSAELAVTLRRLKAANETGDPNVMQAALTAAGAAAHMQGPEAAELQALAMAVASRLADDKEFAKTGRLRRSGQVRARVRRLWDLMVAETTAIRKESGMMRPGETAQDVTLEAYRNMHIRVAKVLAFRDEFDREEALKIADQDWAEDISRFSGTSHITVWLDEIRTKFKEASARAVAEHSFRELFRTFDADGSGELDRKEFRQAVREKLHISEETITEGEVEALFDAVDADGSGEVDSTEFVAWLFPAKLAKSPSVMKGGRKKRSAKGLVRTSSETALKQRFREASERMSQAVGWEIIFQKYDDDNSGELEIDEFTRAVREECQLTEDAVPDTEIEELFGVIDADQSGAIDADELGELLNANLGTATMTFGPFYSSIFELVSVWVPVENESSYVRFLDHVFNSITDAINGHELDLDTARVPVFDDGDQLVANFRLKQLNECLSLVTEDGNLDMVDLDTVNAQDILPENNPMSPAYIENKQAKGRERRKSLSATVSNSSLTSPRTQTGSNPELPTPSPQEESLPVLPETEDTGEDEDTEPLLEPEAEPEQQEAPAAIMPRKQFQPRPPPPKLTMSDDMCDDINADKFGEGGWRRLASPVSNAIDAKAKTRHGDLRATVASHWTYGAVPPSLRYGSTTAAPPPAAMGAGMQVGADGYQKQSKDLPAVRLNPSRAAGMDLSQPEPRKKPSSLAGKGKAQRLKKNGKPRPTVRVDAIVGTGPLSGRRLWSSGGIPPPPSTAGSRLTTPRVLGAAGFRFAPPPSRRAGSGALEHEFQRSSTSLTRAQTVGVSTEESWRSPFEKIGGRMAPPMAAAAIPNRPHTGHCTLQQRKRPAAVASVLLRPAAVPSEGNTAREALGYDEAPLYLHLIPGAVPGTPRSTRGLRTGGISLRAPLLSPGKPHRGLPHNQFELPIVDLASAVAAGQDLPAQAGPKPGSWGRLPPGQTSLLGVATR
jgi:Ca2+-binding EF-hand superfamily protein